MSNQLNLKPVDASFSLKEHIYDVPLSDRLTVAADGSVPPVGNTGYCSTAPYTNHSGDPDQPKNCRPHDIPELPGPSDLEVHS